MSKTKLFIVTTYFTPTVSVASGRMLAFAKYLNKSYFDVIVITLGNSKKKECVQGVGMVEYIENNLLIKAANFDKKTNYFLHKLKVLWNVFLRNVGHNHLGDWQKKACNFLGNELLQNPDSIVITSFSPDSPHVIAILLKEKKIPFYWVADFRDEMSNNPFLASNQLRNRYIKIESKIKRYADVTSTVSKPLSENCEKLFTKTCLEIRNGFDFNQNIERIKNPLFTINFVGTFYGKIKPDVFFKALINVLPHIDNLKINLFGRCSNILVPKALKDIVVFQGVVDSATSYAAMQEADVLLLILNKNKNYKGVYSTKIFEYLGSGRHVLACIDKTDVANTLLVSCNAGYIADCDDVLDIQNAILTCYNDWKNDTMLDLNYDAISKLHRHYEVNKLNDFLISKLKTR